MGDSSNNATPARLMLFTWFKLNSVSSEKIVKRVRRLARSANATVIDIAVLKFAKRSLLARFRFASVLYPSSSANTLLFHHPHSIQKAPSLLLPLPSTSPSTSESESESEQYLPPRHRNPLRTTPLKTHLRALECNDHYWHLGCQSLSPLSNHI